MEIEYRSRQSGIVSNLCIRQVYDRTTQSLVNFQQAIDRGYLDTDLYWYSCSDLSMPIHDAFYRGLIIGELRTSTSEQTLPELKTSATKIDEFEREDLISLLTKLLDSLREFLSTVVIIDECQLTTDGYIQHRKSGQCYLLTQAMELGLVVFSDRL